MILSTDHINSNVFKYFLIKPNIYLIILCITITFKFSYAQNKKTTFYHKNGKIASVGILEYGKPNGYWKNYDTKGNLIAEGNRVDFKLNGTWKFYEKNENLYKSINYYLGKKNGTESTYKQGKLYSNINYKNGIKHGFYFEYYPNGKVSKEIVYSHGNINEKGYEYAKDGRIITLLKYRNNILVNKFRINRMDTENRMQNIWIEFYKSKTIRIKGYYLDNLKHGYFKYYDENENLINIEKYEHGKLLVKNKEDIDIKIEKTYYKNRKLKKYSSFKGGKLEGIQREYTEEGKVMLSSVYKAGKILEQGGIINSLGKKDGKWVYYYSDGKIRKTGNYRDGLKQGEWIYYYSNGNIEQKGTYIDDEEDGLWILYNTDGIVIKKDNYSLGKKNGEYIEYDINGNEIVKGEYYEDLKEGEWIYQLNHYKEIGYYKEGVKHGEWKQYNIESDHLMFIGYYDYGEPKGEWIHYYSNGKIKEKGIYKNGFKHDKWIYYDIEGKKNIEILYRLGMEIEYNGVSVKQE